MRFLTISLLLVALCGLLLAACGPEPLPLQGFADSEPLDHGFDVGWTALPESAMPLRRVPQVALRPLAQAPDSRRVVLLGLDGMDWRLVEPLLQAGLLPNLERLLAGGAAGILATDFAHSPTSWTTIATGRAAARHGVTPDYKLSWAAMQLEPRELEVRRVWEMARERDRTIAVFDYYFCRPRPAGAWGMIPDLTAEGDKLLPDGLTLAGCNRPAAGELEPLYQDACLLGRRPADLAVLLVQQTDVAGHKGLLGWLQRWHDELLLQDDAVVQLDQPDRLSATYIQLDAALGYLKDNLPAGSHLVICSDHGFGAPWATHLRADLGPDVLKALGVEREQVEQEQAGIRIDSAAGTLRVTRSYDYQPLHLAHFVGRETAETTWLVREQLLIEGRDPGWIERVRGLLDSSLAERSGLLELSVVQGRGLLIRPAAEFATRRACGALTDRERGVLDLEFVCAHHNPGDDGVILIVGPHAVAGARIEGARLVDVTPTVLYLLGLPVGRDLDGRVLIEALDPAALRARPVQYVDTYETSPIERDPVSLSEIGMDHELMTPELIERLKSLGYLN